MVCTYATNPLPKKKKRGQELLVVQAKGKRKFVETPFHGAQALLVQQNKPNGVMIG